MDRNLALVMNNYAELLQTMNRHVEAGKMKAEAKKIEDTLAKKNSRN